MKTRIYFLDNLRTFLIFLVVLLHSGLVYESALKNTWIVWDPTQNDSIGLVRLYLDIFVMFIIFFISGYFVPFSIKGKSAWGFIKSKFNRLMIPWFIAVFTLIPAYKVIFLYSRGLPQEAWYTYFHLYQRGGSDLGFFANSPMQNWLWFLPVLFLFQILYLALARTKLTSIKPSLKTGVILVFTISLVYSMIVSELGWRGWYHSPLLHFQNERLLPYFLTFLLGSLCNKLNIFESTNRNKKYYVISNVLLTLSLGVFTVVALNLFFNMIDPSRNFYFVSEFIDRAAYHISMLLSMLSFLYILIYVFRFNFNKSYRIMSELNKNSYAVYIIHVIVIGLIALIFLHIPLPAMVKFLIVAMLSFILSNLVVSIFRKPFQYILSQQIVKVAIPVAAILLSALVYAQVISQEKELRQTKSQESQSKTISNIHEAAFYGDVDSMKEYIIAGSDLNQKDAYGSTPLIIAIIFDKTDVAILLIEAGADLAVTNNDGSTPLHIAAFFCRTYIVEVLLEKGVDRSVKNNAGSTALETVTVPFEYVKGIYDATGASLEPFGLILDYEQIEKTRPMIARMLKNDDL